jgi:hypothetical protein
MRKLLLLVALLICVSAKAQKPLLGEMEQYINVADLLPDNVDVQGATQGFAIHGRYGFSMHDKGQCVIIDLKRKEFVTTFIMEGNTGHCNNASFGVERYSRRSPFPLFYVTECRGDRVCYVNDITLTGSRLVQTIHYNGDDITGPADWAVDARRRHIYLYCTIGSTRYLKIFPLPTLADSDARGEVHLAEEDAIASLPAGNITIPQGSHIYGRYIFLPEGIPPRPTQLQITDLVTAENLSPVELSHLNLEPEGVATKGRWLYLSFHTPRDVRRNIIYRMRINARKGNRR